MGGCHSSDRPSAQSNQEAPALVRTEKAPYLLILGTAQDAGKPHLGCERSCCLNEAEKQRVTSLGIVDPMDSSTFLFEASPDIISQIRSLNRSAGLSMGKTPDAIFLTHAHIGHYTGLMYLGRESMNAEEVPVYAMPRMADFLENNGPWGQLVKLNNIDLKEMTDRTSYRVSSSVSVAPISVPHRDEYSETVGYLIQLADTMEVLFIPDIDKWEKWDESILEWIKQVDVALIDGTFYSGKELNNRDMSTIPHPSVEESMALLNQLSKEDRSKVYFIHLNHTNPLWDDGEERKLVEAAGYHIAREGRL